MWSSQSATELAMHFTSIHFAKIVHLNEVAELGPRTSPTTNHLIFVV